MIVRADMPNDVAYALCEAIELRTPDVADRQLQAAAHGPICANDDEAPYDAPLIRAPGVSIANEVISNSRIDNDFA